MDKIKALMVKAGIRPEVADHLCEGVESYLAERSAQQDALLKSRQEDAKRICLEEVEQHNREVARRLQIFCEAKGAEVERTVAKQTAAKESEALSKLYAISNMLEGVAPTGEQTGDLQAENSKLKRQLKRLSEETRRAVNAANRHSALAAKVLEKNRMLEGKLQRANRGELSEGSGQRPRLDNGRRRRPSGDAVTTRPTLQENQDLSRRRQQRPAPNPADPITPDGIARMMEPDLV